MPSHPLPELLEQQPKNGLALSSRPAQTLSGYTHLAGPAFRVFATTNMAQPVTDWIFIGSGSEMTPASRPVAHSVGSRLGRRARKIEGGKPEAQENERDGLDTSFMKTF